MVRSEIAVLRFGLGARPGELTTARSDPHGWLRSQTLGAVPLATNTPLAPSAQIFAAVMAAREARRDSQRAKAGSSDTTIDEAANPVRDAYVPHYRAQVLARAQSAALTTRPFAERLVHFWSNHFAVSADKGAIFGLAGTLENEAIRPHVNGRFSDLLTAVEQHPAMIAFLDNQYSVGADSVVARAAARRTALVSPARNRFGINENLAREILELHTLGVGGGYTQLDVTTFAQMITGWSIGGGRNGPAGVETGRFLFRDDLHEPGPKSFLGRRYAEEGRLQGEAALEDLAANPATARFIATKLVRHFIADGPPSRAVEHVARAFLKSEGDLPHVYSALIDAPEAWQPTPRKFKTPEDLVFSTWRALDMAPARPAEVLNSLEFLGQRPYTCGSPAGWPDIASAWDGSDALVHRISWACRVAEHYGGGSNPVDIALAALGAQAREATLSAVRRAVSGAQGLTLFLMSPEFQRR